MVPITIVFMGFINHQTSLGGPTLYPLVICQNSSWKWWFSSWIYPLNIIEPWWIFPVRYVNIYQAGYVIYQRMNFSKEFRGEYLILAPDPYPRDPPDPCSLPKGSKGLGALAYFPNGTSTRNGESIVNNWLVLWNMNLMTFHSVGNSNPNWLIFFRGVETTNQP